MHESEKFTRYNWGIVLIQVALLAITGIRTVDLVNRVIPDDFWIFSIAFVMVQEVANLLMLHAYINTARGAGQRNALLAGVWVTYAGIATATITDVVIILAGKKDYTTFAWFGTILVTAIPVLVLFLLILYTVSDPESKRKLAAREAEDLIEETRIKYMRENAPYLASELAKVSFENWIANQRASSIATMYQHQPVELPPAKPAPKPKPTFSADGGGDEEPLNFTQPHRKYHE